MRKWMILLAAVLMLLVGCGKEPAVAGLSNEECRCEIPGKKVGEC